MTQKDAASYVLRLWRDERLGPDDFNASTVMVWLTMLGVPCSRSDVLKVARSYCDSQSENVALIASSSGQR